MRISYVGGTYILSGYWCSRCSHKTQCKLWRRPPPAQLLCVRHLAQEIGAQITSFTREGFYMDDQGISDTVVGWFSAIPSEATDQEVVTAYYDYGLAPADGCRWWRGYPL